MTGPGVLLNTAPDTGDDVRFVAFDVDKTIRVGTRRPFPVDGDDFVLLPFVASKIAHMNKLGYFVAMFSNQAGIHHNLVTKDKVIEGMLRTIERLQESDPEAKIHYYDFSEGYDYKRKPARGMFYDLFYRLDDKAYRGNPCGAGSRRLVVGDAAYRTGVGATVKVNTMFGPKVVRAKGEDAEFAKHAHAEFTPPADFFGWRSLGIDGFFGVDEVKAFNEVRTQCMSRLTTNDRENTELAFEINRSMNTEDLIKNVFPSGDILNISRSLMQRVHPDKSATIYSEYPYLQGIFASAFQRVRDVYQRANKQTSYSFDNNDRKSLIRQVYFRLDRKNPFYMNVEKHYLEKTGHEEKFFRTLFVSSDLRCLAENLFAHFTHRDVDVLLNTIRSHETILDTDVKTFLLILRDRLFEGP